MHLLNPTLATTTFILHLKGIQILHQNRQLINAETKSCHHEKVKLMYYTLPAKLLVFGKSEIINWGQ